MGLPVGFWSVKNAGENLLSRAGRTIMGVCRFTVLFGMGSSVSNRLWTPADFKKRGSVLEGDQRERSNKCVISVGKRTSLLATVVLLVAISCQSEPGRV